MAAICRALQGLAEYEEGSRSAEDAPREAVNKKERNLLSFDEAFLQTFTEDDFPLRGEALREAIGVLGSEASAMTLALRDLGLPVTWEEFPCRLPGHSGTARYLRDEKSGLCTYWCGCAREEFSIAELRAAQGHGKLAHRSKSEQSVWYARLFWEAGVIDLEPIRLPPLPSGVSQAVVRVADGFRTLFAIKQISHPGQPAMFSHEFGRAWCELLSVNVSARAIRRVVALGVVRRAGKYRQANLYRPGEAM